MDLLQRSIQRDLLQQLSELYPHKADMRRSFSEIDRRQVGYNLFYLREHGLVEVGFVPLMDNSIRLDTASITAKGIDFITGDGGLGAILNVVTIKLHEDTIRSLLIDKVTAADGDEGLKASLITRIKGLPSEALGSIAQKALDAGLDQLPDLISAMGGWISTQAT